MTDTTEKGLHSPVSPISPAVKATDAPPESPTTARPLDFEDDAPDYTPTSTLAPLHQTSAPNPPPKDAPPPTKPPRPISAREQAELTLKEAFPSIDASVVKAVLTASGGQVEPAFNALLGMSDPDSQREPEPPAKPPRPVAQPTSTARSQLEADEMYARQLHEHLSGATVPSQEQQQRSQRQPSRYNENLKGSREGRPGANPNPDDVPWRSFIDDDLPEIRDNIKKGFFETQTTVNKWLGNLKKKIDGEEPESDFTSQPAQPAQNWTPGQGPWARKKSSDVARRSADMSRYDADPQVIGDDFSRLEMRDSDLPERRSSRPLANPNLFRPDLDRTGSQGSGRKVSFQEGPPEEIKDMYSGSPAPNFSTRTGATPASAKPSKWQPLSTVEPSPVADSDPFSLGDSDDEKDAKHISLRDVDDDEEGRLQKATAEAMKDSMGVDAKK